MSHVQVSFKIPKCTGNANRLGTLRILSVVKLLCMETKQEFIRLQLQNYMERYKAFYNLKQLLSIREALKPLPKGMGIGLPQITGNHMEYLPVTGFFFNHESPIN